MSTLYTINAHTSTSVSATDQFPMFKTSSGNTHKVAASAIQTYVLGLTTSSTVGFFGATVTAQPTSANQAACTTTASVSVSATQWGYSTSTQASAIPVLLAQIRLDLISLGLIKGS